MRERRDTNTVAGNLTRNEARERARLLTVDSYAVDLDLTAGEERFTSVTVVRFRCTSPGAATFIELEAEGVREIILNGSAVETSAFRGSRITLADLAATNEARIVADCTYSRTGEGLQDRKSTRLNSSHEWCSYSVFCLKKKRVMS